jgi:hypothetical protein
VTGVQTCALPILLNLSQFSFLSVSLLTIDICSNNTCTDLVPEECADIIPYTSYPNTLFGLNNEEDYTNFTNTIKAAMSNCTMEEEWAHWGVCNIMFPRCLLGFDLQLCRNTCLGNWPRLCIVTAGSFTRFLSRMWCTDFHFAGSLILYVIAYYILCVLDGVRESCHGKSRDQLEKICMRLPEDMCLSAPYMERPMCEEHEWDCGDGQCIHGLGVCDNKYQCMNGADELEWWAVDTDLTLISLNWRVIVILYLNALLACLALPYRRNGIIV